jgi:hypothetical protein
LDSILVSINWEIIFPLAVVHKIRRNYSHHNPLILKLNNDHVEPIKNFRYELFWKNEEDFLERVKKSWLQLVFGKDNLSWFLLKLKNVKNH